MKTHRPKLYRKTHKKQRGNANQRGYGHRWRVYCKTFKIVHPLCEGYTKDESGQPVHAVGCGYATEHVDHIKAVTGPDDPLFWEPTNHQGLSGRCHASKTVREDKGFGRRSSRQADELSASHVRRPSGRAGVEERGGGVF